MKKTYFSTSFDEFNALFGINFDVLNHAPCISYTITFSDYDILNTHIDKILILATPKLSEFSDVLLDYIIHKNSNPYNVIKEIEEERNEKLNLFLKKSKIIFLSRKYINKNIRGEKHVISYVFANTIKRLMDGKLNFIYPKKDDYLSVKEELSQIQKPIISINARNLRKSTMYNNLLIDIITKSLEENFYVINLTLNCPNLNFNSSDYIEIKDTSYSKRLSYFLNSNCVISKGDSAGISTHLLTPANFLLCTNAPFIHNKGLGYKGKTLLDARIENTTFNTAFMPTYNIKNRPDSAIKEQLDYCKSLNKPEIEVFFDESKLITNW